MKAITSRKNGSADVLKLEDLEKPIPGKNQVLVKVKASSVTRGDVMMRKLPRFLIHIMGALFGFKAKVIPGTEFAGIIEEKGTDVSLFEVGDEVFGTTTGLITGGNAEYVCVPEKWKNGVITIKPGRISFVDAAVSSVGAMTVLYNLRNTQVKKGKKVLVYGASGSVGSFAVQIFKSMAAKVTAVCSTANVDWVKEYGADHVIDYTKEDFTQSGVAYDYIFDAVGKTSKSKCRKSLSNKGKFFSIKKPTKELTENLEQVAQMLNDGQLKPYIEKIYPLEGVIEAHRIAESGRKKGNIGVLITKE